MQNLFLDLGLIIIVATILAFLARLIKQPVIPAYILTGYLLGPWRGLITDKTTIQTLSEIGITFLLFIVGLEIDFRKLKHIGLAGSLGGVIQIVAVFATGFIVAALFGFVPLEAIYIGIVITFSSTMVVLKLLSDKRELDTLHGRITIGILLLQDVFAIFALSILATLDHFSAAALLKSVFGSIVIIVIAWLLSKYVFPRMFKIPADTQELLMLLSIGVLFLFAIAFNYIGFSIAIGAFIAGVTLANLPYNIEIIGKVTSLRDFFATLFFVSLGMELVIKDFGHLVLPLIVFLAIIMVFKPLLVSFVTAYFGFKKRTAFYTGMSLAQISEFSLIVVSQGLYLGHVSQDIFSLTVLLGAISITMTSYFIKYDTAWYYRFSRRLEFLDKWTKSDQEELEYKPDFKAEAIVLGHNRIGFSIARTLRKLRRKMMVVDFNPEVVKYMMQNKIPCMYGDVGDLETIQRLPFKTARLVISTIPDVRDNLLIVKKSKEANKKIIVYVTANDVETALTLYDAGADYVILPHFLGGEHVSLLIQNFTGKLDKILELKLNHIKELHQRRLMGHEHPHHEKAR